MGNLLPQLVYLHSQKIMANSKRLDRKRKRICP
jgi:hypothetical protein